MFHQSPDFVPRNVEAYAVTDFNPNTYFGGKEETFSTHALQFYRIVRK